METITLLAITLLCWGVTPIMEKVGLEKASPLAGLTIRSLAVTIGLIIWTVAAGRAKELFATSNKEILIFTGSGLLAGLFGMMTYFAILKSSETSAIVPLTASYPLVTAILSYALLKENLSWQKLTGTMLIISGILLIKYNNK